MTGEVFIIESDAEGRKMQRAIVIGIKAAIINIYPFYKIFDIAKRMNPNIKNIKHNTNL